MAHSSRDEWVMWRLLEPVVTVTTQRLSSNTWIIETLSFLFPRRLFSVQPSYLFRRVVCLIWFVHLFCIIIILVFIRLVVFRSSVVYLFKMLTWNKGTNMWNGISTLWLLHILSVLFILINSFLNRSELLHLPIN